MIDAPTLIALIESGRSDDPVALDAIDVQVSLFLGHPLPLRYTRSRDVLKSIRPAGLLVKIENWPAATSVLGCFIQAGGKVISFESGGGPTEELSELHVIIQATAYQQRQFVSRHD